MRNTTRWAAVAALPAPGLGACGDDDDSSDDAATEDTGGGGEGGGDECTAEETSEATVTIVDFAFDPTEVSVASGGVVAVSNEDGTTHTFTSADAGFDCEIAGGEAANVLVAAAPGEYEFHCEIHPSMTGTLTVA